jgi:hypothetical protein
VIIEPILRTAEDDPWLRFLDARRICERAYQSADAQPSTGFRNSSADNQISPSSQFAETIHRFAVGFGCDNLEAPRAQQGSRCLKHWGVIIDHHDKLAGVSHHHLPRL